MGNQSRNEERRVIIDAMDKAGFQVRDIMEEYEKRGDASSYQIQPDEKVQRTITVKIIPCT